MLDRMTNYVSRNYATVPESGCWIWLGAWDSDGYGKLGNGGRNFIAVHRLFYAYYKGEIEDGKSVCHTCDTPCCINPEHLFLGTAQDNAVDREKKRRGRWTKRRREPQRHWSLEATKPAERADG
jgi:hypothetical protein